MRFQPGSPKPPGSGRKPGQRNKATIEAQEAIKAALGGKTLVERLMEIAKDRPQREEEILMYLGQFVLPKLTSTTLDADVTNHEVDNGKIKEMAQEARNAREQIRIVKPSGAG